MVELAEGYYVLYGVDAAVQLTLFLVFISQLLTTRHLQKQRKLYEKEYVVRQGRHPVGVGSSRRPSANVQLSPIAAKNRKAFPDESDATTTTVSPRLAADGQKRLSINPSLVRPPNPVPFIPPPQIGRIPRFLHFMGLLASILQVVRAVDIVSLNGFYPTLFVRFLSNGTSLILLYGGCAVVDDFIGLRYKMVFSRTPPIARRVIIGIGISATVIVGTMLAIRSVHDWRFTLGTYNLVWGFSALILSMTLNVSIFKLSYRINSTDNAFLVKFQRPSTSTPQFAAAPSPEANPELVTLGNPALPSSSSPNLAISSPTLIVVDVTSPLPSPTPLSETPGGPSGVTPGGPGYSATFAQLPIPAAAKDTPTGDAVTVTPGGDAPATVNESQSVDRETSAASDARMLTEQSARPSLISVRLEPVPTDAVPRSDSTSTADNQVSVSRDLTAAQQGLLCLPSSAATVPTSAAKGGASSLLQLPQGQAVPRSSMFSPNPNAFHVALKNMRWLALCTTAVGIGAAAFAVTTAMKYFTTDPLGPQIVAEADKPWSDDLTPIIIQTFILCLFLWYAWVPIPLLFKNFLAEYEASTHSGEHALASPVAVVHET